MRTIVSVSIVVAVAVCADRGVNAQNVSHQVCGAPPSYVPPELLTKTLPLRQGVGNSRETVTTNSSEAQAFYNQGLNYLQSYVWIEASRSFHQALRLDPTLAMAYLGLSYVSSGLESPEGAKQYFETAKAFAAGLSERERLRIEIREKQLAALVDLRHTARFLSYKKEIDDALAKNPADPEF